MDEPTPPPNPALPPPLSPPLPDVRDRSAIYFLTDDLQQGLGRRTARGGAYTLGTTAVNFVVTTAATILVTRHLSKEDFGLYGMVIVLTGFASMFVDLGLSRAVVQKPQINHGQVSTLFWINLALASIIAVVVAALTPVLVWFYNEPRLVPINLAMSGLFVVGALGLQHRALLERRMEFGRLNVISLIAPLIASAVAVALALLDYGYWALVAIPAVSQVVTVVAMWVMCRWLPGLPRKGTGVRQMLAFGGHVTGFQFVNYFARNADNAMLGFAWGAGPLGLYTRAYSLMMLPATKLNAPLTGVVVPALSRLSAEPVRYRAAYRKAIFLLTSLTSIPIVWMVLLSPELIPMLLGEQWRDTVPVLLLLSPAVLVASNNVAPGWLYLSFGHVDRQLRWAVMVVPFQLVAMMIGLQWGAQGMALAVGLFYPLHWLPYMAYATQTTPVTLGDYISAAGRPQALTIVAAAFAALLSMVVFDRVGTASDPMPILRHWLTPEADFAETWRRMALKSLAYVCFLGLGMLIFSSLRSEMVSATQVLRQKRLA